MSFFSCALCFLFSEIAHTFLQGGVSAGSTELSGDSESSSLCIWFSTILSTLSQH